MKKLSEIKGDDYLVIEPLNEDAVVMDKEEFMGSHWYLDKDLAKVSLAKETYANFDLYYALECIGDDMHEDWLSDVMNSIPIEVRERIEKETNGYLEKEPTYYPGEEIEWRAESGSRKIRNGSNGDPGQGDREEIQEVIPVEKRLRDMTWEDYGISKNRYKELKAFCLQYDEKKSKIKYGIPAMQYDGQPKAHSTGSQVENQAIENDIYKRDCAMIEEAAIRANPGIWRYILKSATKGIPYEHIEYDEEQGRIPMGKTDFNANRRLFYYNLHCLKIGFKLSNYP